MQIEQNHSNPSFSYDEIEFQKFKATFTQLKEH
jgi:hypothetical protein